MTSEDELVRTLSGLTHVVALTMVEIDRLPLEDRTADRLTSFLQEACISHAQNEPGPVSRRLLRVKDRLLEHIEELRRFDSVAS